MRKARYEMHITFCKIDTWQKSAFYEAYFYAYERHVDEGYIQKQFSRYMHSGGEYIPECCVDWAIDILAGRIWY